MEHKLFGIKDNYLKFIVLLLVSFINIEMNKFYKYQTYYYYHYYVNTTSCKYSAAAAAAEGDESYINDNHRSFIYVCIVNVSERSHYLFAFFCFFLRLFSFIANPIWSVFGIPY